VIFKIYEDNAVGKLNDERFAHMSGNYERELAAMDASASMAACAKAANSCFDLRYSKFPTDVRSFLAGKRS